MASSEDQVSEVIPKSPSFLLTLWRFTRPHTLVGSAIAVPALHFFAAPVLKSTISLKILRSIVTCLIPSLLMNVYITGLNQITDVEIDKINKPYLPIAAGDLTQFMASLIVTGCLLSSISFGLKYGAQGLNVALLGSAVLGTMYSLPPFRLKRFPAFAAFCIVAVRGTIINAGFFAEASSVVFGGASSVLSCLKNDRRCLLSSLYFGIYGVIIALMKDVPDVEGDELMSIRSFSVRAGQKKIFAVAKNLVSVLFMSCGLCFYKGVFNGSHLSLRIGRSVVGTFSIWMAWRARVMGRGVNANDKEEVFDYYMYLWKLFYLSYLALPFAR